MQVSEVSKFNAGAAYEPASTAEDALVGTLLGVGRRWRTRLDGDTLDFSLVPILRTVQLCGPQRVSSVADQLRLDASTVSRHIKQLEDRGLLERTTDPDDGRASRIALTAEGASALDDHIARRK